MIYDHYSGHRVEISEFVVLEDSASASQQLLSIVLDVAASILLSLSQELDGPAAASISRYLSSESAACVLTFEPKD